MNSNLSHVALLVASVEASATFLNSHRIKTNAPETFEAEGSKEIYVGSYDTQRGLLLLLEAISEGPHKRAWEKRGPSLHHISIDVLNIKEFISNAESIGWKLHPMSEETLTYDTAWLFLKGIPTLIEIQQRSKLFSKPLRISKITLPISESQMALFKGIGLGDIVRSGDNIGLTIDDYELSFSDIARLK